MLGLSEERPRRGAVVLLNVRPGRFEVLSSSIAPERHVNVVSVDDAGHLLVGAREGWVGWGSLQDGLLGWAQLPGEGTSVDHIVPAPGATPGFIVAASGGSAYRIDWPDVSGAARLALPGDPTSPTALTRLARSEDAPFVLLRSFAQPLLSVDGQHWTEDRLEVPPEAARCARAADACGDRSFIDIVDLAGPLDDTALVVAPRHCTALFRYEPQRRCVTAVSLPGVPTIENVPPERWRGTKRRGDRVIAFGDKAWVVELSP